MAYEKNNFKRGQNLTAEQLNKMEKAIASPSWNDLTDKPFGEEREVILPEGSYGSNYYFDSLLPLVLDETYIVVLEDGTEKTYVCKYDWYAGGDDDLYIGEATPSNVWQGDYRLCVTKTAVYYGDIKAIYKDGVKPLDEKYIPDTIARKTDIPEVPEHTWETLPDKPFGEETRKKIQVRKSSVSAGETYYCEDMTEDGNWPRIEVGHIYYAVVNGETFEREGNYIHVDGNERAGFNVYLNAEQTECVPVWNAGGTALAIKNETSNDIEIEISEKVYDVKTLDEKFMPTLTSPNGTKYKITVANDGTLSATAV